MASQQLEERESNVGNYVYDPSTHINTFCNNIQDFQGIWQLVGQGNQDYQLENQAYIIFEKNTIFKDSLMPWNRKQQDKTYNDFKIFMRSK